jgi:hypothetical protein
VPGCYLQAVVQFQDRMEHTMAPNDKPIHVESEDARAGSTPHIVRYVLAISMILAVIALGVIWAVFRH